MANPLGRGVVVTITDTDERQEMLHIFHKSYAKEQRNGVKIIFIIANQSHSHYACMPISHCRFSLTVTHCALIMTSYTNRLLKLD